MLSFEIPDHVPVDWVYPETFIGLGYIARRYADGVQSITEGDLTDIETLFPDRSIHWEAGVNSGIPEYSEDGTDSTLKELD
jgi:hypothetical protein